MKTFRYIDDSAILTLDPDACIGCGMCRTVCPHRVFTLNNKKARIVDRNGCMECGACGRNCPVEAIHVNPDNGCGCAAMLINNWLSKVLKKKVNFCSC